MNKIGDLNGKNILFLQGPMGLFFKKLNNFFCAHGANSYTIGFNAGDWFFSNKHNYIAYRDNEENWERFIETFLLEKDISKVFLFGDCRFYHSIAIKQCLKHRIDVYVFEEGYIRPHYITMEKYGVNDYSRIPRDPKFYKQIKNDQYIEKTIHAKQSKFKMIISAALYYFFGNLFAFRYPYYRHHRDFSAIKELFYGIRGAIRKVIYPFFERRYLELLPGKLSKKYFFVPLQTHNDFQILQHSQYRSIEKFIIEVIESFAHHAPKDNWLVFKHHPVDRGRKNYKNFILEQAELLNIKNRVLVLHDTFLPTCLKHAKGTVTVNSTVGLTSIGYGIPTITMGNAIYDIEGLTNKGVLFKDFWRKQKKVDLDLYKKYRSYLISNTQLNGSFYGMFPKELID